MKTWKTKRKACRSSKSGRFSFKGRCAAYKRTLIKTLKHGLLFH
jgi:hypothetical protein